MPMLVVMVSLLVFPAKKYFGQRHNTITNKIIKGSGQHLKGTVITIITHRSFVSFKPVDTHYLSLTLSSYI